MCVMSLCASLCASLCVSFFFTFVTHFVLRVSCAVLAVPVFPRLRACTFVCASTPVLYFYFIPFKNCCSHSRSKSVIISSLLSYHPHPPPPPPHNTYFITRPYLQNIVSHVVYPSHPPSISIFSLSTFVPFLQQQ